MMTTMVAVVYAIFMDHPAVSDRESMKLATLTSSSTSTSLGKMTSRRFSSLYLTPMIYSRTRETISRSMPKKSLRKSIDIISVTSE